MIELANIIINCTDGAIQTCRSVKFWRERFESTSKDHWLSAHSADVQKSNPRQLSLDSARAKMSQ